MRSRGTPAPGLRLVLLAILIVMALTADMRIAAAAPGGAEQAVTAPPPAGETPFERQGMWIWHVDRSDGVLGTTTSAKAYEIDPGPAP